MPRCTRRRSKNPPASYLLLRCAALPKACITSTASVMGRREGRAAREWGRFALCKLLRVAFGRGPSSRGLYIGVDDAGSGFGGRRAAAPPCHLETLRNFGDDVFGGFFFFFFFSPNAFSPAKSCPIASWHLLAAAGCEGKQRLINRVHQGWNITKK